MLKIKYMLAYLAEHLLLGIALTTINSPIEVSEIAPSSKG